VGGACSKNGGGERTTYRLLVGKPEGKRPVWISRRMCVDNIKIDLVEIGWVVWTGMIWLSAKWVDNIKVDLGETGWGDVDWSDLAQNKDH
jgi:hypothetical protein